jgi:hypothetical protein
MLQLYLYYNKVYYLFTWGSMWGLGLSRAEDDPVVGASGWGSQPGQPSPTRVVRVSHF